MRFVKWASVCVLVGLCPPEWARGKQHNTLLFVCVLLLLIRSRTHHTIIALPTPHARQPSTCAQLSSIIIEPNNNNVAHKNSWVAPPLDSCDKERKTIEISYSALPAVHWWAPRPVERLTVPPQFQHHWPQIPQAPWKSSALFRRRVVTKVLLRKKSCIYLCRHITRGPTTAKTTPGQSSRSR